MEWNVKSRKTESCRVGLKLEICKVNLQFNLQNNNKKKTTHIENQAVSRGRFKWTIQVDLKKKKEKI